MRYPLSAIVLIIGFSDFCQMRKHDWLKGVPVHQSIPNHPSLQPRIINGISITSSELKFWPFQTALKLHKGNDTYFCGGSLISHNYVLTAAHCTINASRVHILLGASNLAKETPGEVEQTSTNYVVHPEYSHNHFKNDISIIKLETPVTFSKIINPVTLPTRSDAKESFSGYDAAVAGFGITRDFTKNVSKKLQVVPQLIMSNDACKKLLAPSDIHPTTLCTIGMIPGAIEGPCSGDSGGPLVIPRVVESGEITLVEVGLVSFGPLLCSLALPNAFTRITSYLDFIGNHSDVIIKN